MHDQAVAATEHWLKLTILDVELIGNMISHHNRDAGHT